MEQQTLSSLTTVDDNAAVAGLLLGIENASRAVIRWSVVAAFYAAVHCVNAHLWEMLQVEPRDHAERRFFVTTVSDLKPASAAYLRLQMRAYEARYAPGLVVSRPNAESLVVDDLATVRDAVLLALDTSA